jgi:O-antigen ligase
MAAVLFTLPFGTGAVYTDILKVDLILLCDVLLALLYALWLVRTNFLTSIKLRAGVLIRPALFIIVWSMFSLINAIAMTATGLGVFMHLKALFLYLYLVNNIRTRGQLLFAVNALVFSLLFQGLIGTGQFVLGRDLGLGFLGERSYNYGKELARMRGTLGYPNQFGAFIILLLPLAISLAVFVRRSAYKWILIVTSGLGLATLFLTLSRSSWFGFLIATVVFLFLLFRRGLLKPKFIGGFAALSVAVVLIAFLNWDKILARFETGSEAKWRILMIEIAFPIIKSHPVFGVGLNNYQWHSFDDLRFWHPVHNEYLRYAAELGIPGGIFFLWMFFCVLKETYRHVKIRDALFNAIAIGIYCGIIAFMIAINFGPEYQHYRIKMTFWALCGLAFSFSHIRALEAMKQKKQQMAQTKEALPPSVRSVPLNGNGAPVVNPQLRERRP